jgi:hypothetical protein
MATHCLVSEYVPNHGDVNIGTYVVVDFTIKIDLTLQLLLFPKGVDKIWGPPKFLLIIHLISFT